MAQYYLNAESITEDGLTPATGYHNLTSLVAVYTLTVDDIVNVVKTITEITEPNAAVVNIAGTLKAHVFGTLPVINQVANNTFRIQSNMLIKGIHFKTAKNDAWYAILSQWLPADWVTIDGCKFEGSARDGSALSNAFYASGGQYHTPGTATCKVLTIKNCCLDYIWKCTSSFVSFATGQRVIYANNSHATHYDHRWYGPTLRYCQLDMYNCIYKGAPGWIFQTVDPENTVTYGTAAYIMSPHDNYTYAFAGNLPYKRINLGTNLSTITALSNLFPADVNTENHNFLPPSDSLLVNAGTSNAYTPTVDIRGKTRVAPFDNGAYEYVISTNSEGNVTGTMNGHPVTLVQTVNSGNINYKIYVDADSMLKIKADYRTPDIDATLMTDASV